MNSLQTRNMDNRNLASQFILILALCMPMVGFVNCRYFTLRTSGKMFVTFIFDSGFIWAVSISLTFVLTRFTSLPIVPLYLIIQLTDVLKCILGVIFMKRSSWVNNMVSEFRASARRSMNPTAGRLVGGFRRTSLDSATYMNDNSVIRGGNPASTEDEI